MTEYHPIDTNTLPEADAPLDLQVRYHSARARKLQSQAMAAALADAWLNVNHAIRGSGRWLVRQLQQSATRRALMECSDRTLADIGIPREHIHLAARGIDVSNPIAVSQAGLWPRLVASISRMNERRRRQLRIYRELMAYSDRELEEIGLRRGDIPAIARTA